MELKNWTPKQLKREKERIARAIRANKKRDDMRRDYAARAERYEYNVTRENNRIERMDSLLSIAALETLRETLTACLEIAGMSETLDAFSDILFGFECMSSHSRDAQVFEHARQVIRDLSALTYTDVERKG